MHVHMFPSFETLGGGLEAQLTQLGLRPRVRILRMRVLRLSVWDLGLIGVWVVWGSWHLVTNCDWAYNPTDTWENPPKSSQGDCMYVDRRSYSY